MKKTVAIGFLGTNLDGVLSEKRWQRWRPTVGLCRHEDLLIDRLELLHDSRHRPLFEVVRGDIGQISPETAVRGHEMDITDPWDFEAVFAALHDFAGAYPFDPEREDYLMHMTTGTHVAQICLFILTESRHFPARLVQTSPPRRRQGQVGTYRIIDLDLSKYDRLANRFQRDQVTGASFLKSGIDTRNPRFNRLIDRIEQVVIRTRAPVLLAGPTGAGKSQLARRIYELKKARHRVEGPFVEINCATLRGDTAMSTLFGHKRGAFTGAQTGRAGLLKTADGGVLFLDEIGELGLDEQAMMLQSIETKRFLPVGADREISSDFQLLAGTNRDLAEDVAAGRFREDLLARLNLWIFELPGLADRREDIEPNLDYELSRHAGETGNRIAFNKEARTAYLTFALSPAARWSANFRDLSASVTRMATFARGGRIGIAEVREEIERLEAGWRQTNTDDDARLIEQVLGGEALAGIDPFDRPQLAHVMRVCRRHPTLSAAGRALFSVSREKKRNPNDADRLRKYLAKYGLDWQTLTSNKL